MRLLEATLRDRAILRFASELAKANAEQARKLMSLVDDDVARELIKYSESFPESFVIH